MLRQVIIFFFLVSIGVFAQVPISNIIPAGFVDLSKVNSNIKIEMRYNTEWNFIGRAIDGYEANICYLTNEAAQALSKVQTELEKQSYSLLMTDCYRPQRAVNDFVSWVEDADDDEQMKSVYYVEEEKSDLIKNGYIASKSGHSRGSTVDLTIVKNDLVSKNFFEEEKDCRHFGKHKNGQLNMGTYVDCFSKLSATGNLEVNAEAKANRILLKNVMIKYGFKNYSKEWWHFTLLNEPFKDTYFDFKVSH